MIPVLNTWEGEFEVGLIDDKVEFRGFYFSIFLKWLKNIHFRLVR